MKKFLALIAILAIAATAATNYKLPGALVKTQNANVANDKPFYRWSASRTFANADTVFGRIDTATAATSNRYATTTAFNSLRNPIFSVGSSLPAPSAVVYANPDSVICKALFIGLGSDSLTFSMGIFDSLGTSWTTYGGSVTSLGVSAGGTRQVMRASIPWTFGASFRPWITTLDATDSATISYMDCKDK